MNRETSLYLDAVRFAAAVLVAIYHSNFRFLVEEPIAAAGLAHSAVITFFVLSGFVIAHVTSTKETTARSYAVSRIARIYSVAVPALIITMAVDTAGQALRPEIYAGRTANDLWSIRLATSLVFLNEIWSISIMFFSNVAYWSLNYEVWYYVLFGIAMFCRAGVRGPLILLVCLLLGPKTLLLLPVWLLGVLLHRSRWLHSIPEPLGWILFFGTVLLLWQFHVLQVEASLSAWLKGQIGTELHRTLSFSGNFLSDYILGVLIVMNFASFMSISRHFSQPLRLMARPIRYLAGFTFSLYLLHQPLILFFSALIRGDPAGRTYYWTVMSLMLLSVWIIGQFTEQKRTQARDLVAATLDGAARRMRLRRQ